MVILIAKYSSESNSFEQRIKVSEDNFINARNLVSFNAGHSYKYSISVNDTPSVEELAEVTHIFNHTEEGYPVLESLACR